MRAETKRTAILLVIAFVIGGAFWSMVPNLFVMHKRAAAPQPARGIMTYFEDGDPAARNARAQGSLIPAAEAAVLDRKIIRTADLALIVTDVARAADSVRTIVQRRGGFVEKSSFQENVQRQRSGQMVVRVPSAGIDGAIAELKRLAVRVSRENVEARDVTRDYMDMDAALRNMRAEEDQYLSILKRASKIQDTLDTTEKIQNVRGRIDKLQGELNYLRGQVDMSAITIALEPEAQAQVAGIYWRPLVNARVALHDMLEGMGEWVDAIVAFAINLPLIAVWVVTILFAIAVLWRLGRRLWRVILPGIRGPRRVSVPAPASPTTD